MVRDEARLQQASHFREGVSAPAVTSDGKLEKMTRRKQ